jgi:hypothetical protein
MKLFATTLCLAVLFVSSPALFAQKLASGITWHGRSSCASSAGAAKVPGNWQRSQSHISTEGA